ncbi:hypothetical protein JR338_07165 [Chloroflexota bacterium]|nr:hypothetical protein JR338_07165 [Chloroflexota bacterium]
MSKIEVPQNYKKEFVDLCKRTNVIRPARFTLTRDGKRVPILYHDRFWKKPEVITKLSKITCDLIEINSQIVDQCNAIICITTLLGTLGPIPIMPFISQKFNWDNYVIKEDTPGEFNIYPNISRNLDDSQDLAEITFLLFIDGTVRGSSIVRTKNTIINLGGHVGGLFMFTDVDNHLSSTQSIIDDVPTLSILSGEELLILTKEG